MKLVLNLGYESLSRNVQNTDEFKTFASKLSTDTDVQLWLNSTFRRWLFTNGPASKIDKVSADSPQWAQDAAAKGELYHVDYAAAENLMRPIIDYFNYLKREKKDFSRITYEEADKQQRKWHEELAAKAGSSTIVNEDGISVVKMFDTGYAWVKVFGKDSLDREGDIMGHCVGSYYTQVMEETCSIYSLRDKKNIPHVTVEVRHNNTEVSQIKGTANTEIVPKYRPYVMDFLKTHTFQHIKLDESGIKPDDVRKVVPVVGGSSKKIKFKGESFSYFNPPRPTFNNEPADKLYTGKNSSMDVTLEGNSVVSNSYMVDRDLLLAMLEYSQVNELCGFSLYSEPYGYRRALGDDKSAEAYGKTVLSLSCYTQNIGGSSFMFSNKPGAFWPILSSRLSRASVLVSPESTKKPCLAIAIESGAVHVVSILSKVPASVLQDVKTWLKGRPLLFSVMSNSKAVRDLEAQFAPAEQHSSNGISDASSLDYSHLQSNTKFHRAMEFFARQSYNSLKVHAVACDRLNSYLHVREYYKKNKISTSGFLYEYFPSFFILLLMKNKKLAMECLSSNTSFAKQFEAFTSAPAGILSGMFARQVDSSELGMAYKEISRNITRLVPWAEPKHFVTPSVQAKFARIYKRFYMPKGSK